MKRPRRLTVSLRYTARELGAVLAHAYALSRLRSMQSEKQLDLFVDRASVRREWGRILGSALEARANG